MPVRLSVNINKIALIRNSRGGNLPDLVQVAKDLESYGAEGITIHPRPDERHARYSDIPALKEVVTTELNVEGNPTDRFLYEVLQHKPHQCTLVPDSPSALTSDRGWDTVKERSFLTDVVTTLKQNGIRVSIFIDASEAMVEGAAVIRADRVEFYTGHYSSHYKINPEKAVADHVLAALVAQASGIGINAGHDLNLLNLKYYAQQVPGLAEVSIGHALVCDALYYGLENVVGMYRNLLK